ncbi:MAG: hypothetical protein QM803_18095 [Rhodocyclaceae bacterium]
MNTENKKSGGQHRAGMVQMKTWLPNELKNDFASLCAVQGLRASVVLRSLLAAYVSRASGAPHGKTEQH